MNSINSVNSNVPAVLSPAVSIPEQSPSVKKVSNLAQRAIALNIVPSNMLPGQTPSKTLMGPGRESQETQSKPFKTPVRLKSAKKTQTSTPPVFKTPESNPLNKEDEAKKITLVSNNLGDSDASEPSSPTLTITIESLENQTDQVSPYTADESSRGGNALEPINSYRSRSYPSSSGLSSSSSGSFPLLGESPKSPGRSRLRRGSFTLSSLSSTSSSPPSSVSFVKQLDSKSPLKGFASKLSKFAIGLFGLISLTAAICYKIYKAFKA